ncbi:hypothetical protein F5877DRAFT_83301 [Lentinula edodes]|nr:hypothetical protein F5877DRAFT_83301 [Lentinula edodes]
MSVHNALVNLDATTTSLHITVADIDANPSAPSESGTMNFGTMLGASSNAALLGVDGTTTSLHITVADIDANPSAPAESGTMKFGTMLGTSSNIADCPITSPSIAIDANPPPLTLAEPIVPLFQSVSISYAFVLQFENQHLEAFMQLDPNSKEKVLSVLMKAFLDLKTIAGSEQMFGKLLKLVNHDHGRKYVVVLVAAGSALLGALAMFLVLAFL